MSIETTVKSANDTKNVTFPSLRRGNKTGKIYFFSSPTEHGICLQGFPGKTNLPETSPFVGSITLEST